MDKLGHEISESEVDDIMNTHDLIGDNVISFIEFKALLMDIRDVRA